MRLFLISSVLLLTSTTINASFQDTPIIIQELRPQSWDSWSELSGKDLVAIADDDIQRHAGDTAYRIGMQIEERYVRENGFVWHLLRFTNISKPDGPLWIVPHDDENAAFESMIAGLKQNGGVGIAINSGAGSVRKQAGKGTCGGRPSVLTSCDPNRNFSDASPKFTNIILAEHRTGQPLIALHTNMPGFGEGRGDITILDQAAARLGQRKPRKDGYFGNGSIPELDDADVFAIMPYSADSGISPLAMTCRKHLNMAGVHVWHERVGKSDGSLSNYIALQRPDIAYVNFEAKRESDLNQSAKAQGMMIKAYMKVCAQF
jgi:hypothetical protein